MRDLAQISNSAVWSTVPNRRGIIPRYSNTLSRVSTRIYTCKTCEKTFSNVRIMEKHVSLHHTGRKPVVCPVCDKRFDTRYHMISHYSIHKESNLAQVEPFIRRRRALSDPESRLSTTSFGSIHGMPRKVLRDIYSEPGNKSFGTKQSFIVSDKESCKDESKVSFRLSTRDIDRRESIEEDYSSVKGRRHSSSSWRPVRTERIPSIPSIDPGSIAAIDTVMGPSKSIATSAKSGFLRTAEDRLISSRLQDISLAGWSVTTPKTGSRPSLSRGSIGH